VISSIYSLSCDLNFFWVVRYRITNPKLKTSDLKGLVLAILLFLVFISSGAKKGTVPSIVAYSKDYFDTILQLPTSQSFTVSLLLSMISIFSGLMSQ